MKTGLKTSDTDTLSAALDVIQEMDKGDVVALESRVANLEKEISSLKSSKKAQEQEKKVSIICFSGEWDKLFAALSVAAGSLAIGMEVHLFFTFWAVSALRKSGHLNNNGRTFLQRMFSKMLPCGFGQAPLSKFNFAGLGKLMMKREMKKQGVEDIDTLFNEVKELGAHFHLCDTTTDLFGLSCHEIDSNDNVDQCGVATFLSYALKSKVVLFI